MDSLQVVMGEFIIESGEKSRRKVVQLSSQHMSDNMKNGLESSQKSHKEPPDSPISNVQKAKQQQNWSKSFELNVKGLLIQPQSPEKQKESPRITSRKHIDRFAPPQTQKSQALTSPNFLKQKIPFNISKQSISLVTIKDEITTSPKLKKQSARKKSSHPKIEQSHFGIPEPYETTTEKIRYIDSQWQLVKSNFALPGPPESQMPEIPEIVNNQQIKMSKFLSKQMVNKPRKYQQKQVKKEQNQINQILNEASRIKIQKKQSTGNNNSNDNFMSQADFSKAAKNMKTFDNTPLIKTQFQNPSGDIDEGSNTNFILSPVQKGKLTLDSQVFQYNQNNSKIMLETGTSKKTVAIKMNSPMSNYDKFIIQTQIENKSRVHIEPKKASIKKIEIQNDRHDSADTTDYQISPIQRKVNKINLKLKTKQPEKPLNITQKFYMPIQPKSINLNNEYEAKIKQKRQFIMKKQPNISRQYYNQFLIKKQKSNTSSQKSLKQDKITLININESSLAEGATSVMSVYNSNQISNQSKSQSNLENIVPHEIDFIINNKKTLIPRLAIDVVSSRKVDHKSKRSSMSPPMKQESTTRNNYNQTGQSREPTYRTKINNSGLDTDGFETSFLRISSVKRSSPRNNVPSAIEPQPKFVDVQTDPFGQGNNQTGTFGTQESHSQKQIVEDSPNLPRKSVFVKQETAPLCTNNVFTQNSQDLLEVYRVGELIESSKKSSRAEVEHIPVKQIEFKFIDTLIETKPNSIGQKTNRSDDEFTEEIVKIQKNTGMEIQQPEQVSVSVMRYMNVEEKQAETSSRKVKAGSKKSPLQPVKQGKIMLSNPVSSRQGQYFQTTQKYKEVEKKFSIFSQSMDQDHELIQQPIFKGKSILDSNYYEMVPSIKTPQKLFNINEDTLQSGSDCNQSQISPKENNLRRTIQIEGSSNTFLKPKFESKDLISMFSPKPALKKAFKPNTKTSNLGKSRYTSYIRPLEIISGKQLLKNTSPRLKSTLEYIEKQDSQRMKNFSTLEPMRALSTEKSPKSRKLPEIQTLQQETFQNDFERREEDLQALQELSKQVFKPAKKLSIVQDREKSRYFKMLQNQTNLKTLTDFNSSHNLYVNQFKMNRNNAHKKQIKMIRNQVQEYMEEEISPRDFTKEELVMKSNRIIDSKDNLIPQIRRSFDQRSTNLSKKLRVSRISANLNLPNISQQFSRHSVSKSVCLSGTQNFEPQLRKGSIKYSNYEIKKYEEMNMERIHHLVEKFREIQNVNDYNNISRISHNANTSQTVFDQNQ